MRALIALLRGTDSKNMGVSTCRIIRGIGPIRNTYRFSIPCSNPANDMAKMDRYLAQAQKDRQWITYLRFLSRWPFILNHATKFRILFERFSFL